MNARHPTPRRGLSLVNVFSACVASGNGERCNYLRAALREHLIVSDPETGISKTLIIKQNSNDPKLQKANTRISQELSKIIYPILDGIPSGFYSSNNTNKATSN